MGRVTTGIAVLIASASASAFASQPEGLIVFASHRDGQHHKLWVMNPDGSGQTQLTSGTGYEMTPAWSPDGERIIYVSHPEPGVSGGRIAVINRDGSGMRELTTEVGAYRNPSYSPDGRLILFSKRVGEGSTRLFVMPAEGGQQRAVPLHDLEDAADPMWVGYPCWAPDGQTIAFSVTRQSEWGTGNAENLYRVSVTGEDLQRLTHTGSNSWPIWSPDGGRIAFYSHREDGEGIYIVNPDGSDPQLLSPVWAIDMQPTWSPDGAWLAFVSTRDRSQDILIMRSDGTNVVNLTKGTVPPDFSPAWSPVALPRIAGTAVVPLSWGMLKAR